MFNEIVWDTPNKSLSSSNFSKAAFSINPTNVSKFSLSKIKFVSALREDESSTLEPVSIFATQVVGPGVPISEIYDDCYALKLSCANSQGTDKQCTKSMCVYGSLVPHTNNLLKYTSPTSSVETFYKNAPLIKINGIKRGKFQSIDIENPYSPSTYVSYFKIPENLYPNERLEDYIHRTIGVWSFKDICKSHEACYVANLTTIDNINLLYFGAITFLHEVKASIYWIDYFKMILKAIDLSPYTSSSDLLRDIAGIIADADSKYLQLKKKRKFSGEKIQIGEFARPVYSRLPSVYKIDNSDTSTLYCENLNLRTYLDNSIDIGFRVYNIKEGYKYLPRKITNYIERDTVGLSPFNREVTVTPKDPNSWVKLKPEELDIAYDTAKFTVAGVDSELYIAKNKIDSFYHDILDPNTCKPQILDWIAGILGLLPPSWNTLWETKIKRAVIKNCLGWETSESNFVDFLGSTISTIKGAVLKEFPFSEFPDIFVNAGENFLKYDFSKLKPTIKYYDEGTSTVVTQSPVELKVDQKDWTGLYPSKGSYIHLLWWIMVLGLNRFNPDLELKTIDTGVYKLKTYLDFSENLAIPLYFSHCQVGSIADAQNNNLPNQAVCGVSKLYSDLAPPVVPMSFKYSKLGKNWANINSIVRNWMSLINKPRVQYASFAAGYSSADDVYLENDYTGVQAPSGLELPSANMFNPSAIVTVVISGGAVTGFVVNNGGTGYTYPPSINITGGGGSGATAMAFLNPTSISTITVTNGGSGYTSPPTVTLLGGATATAVLTGNTVTGIIVNNGGSGFTTNPIVTISGGGGSGATAMAVLSPTSIASVVVNNPGTGYISAPTVNIIKPLLPINYTSATTKVFTVTYNVRVVLDTDYILPNPKITASNTFSLTQTGTSFSAAAGGTFYGYNGTSYIFMIPGVLQASVNSVQGGCAPDGLAVLDNPSGSSGFRGASVHTVSLKGWTIDGVNQV